MRALAIFSLLLLAACSQPPDPPSYRPPSNDDAEAAFKDAFRADVLDHPYKLGEEPSDINASNYQDFQDYNDKKQANEDAIEAFDAFRWMDLGPVMCLGTLHARRSLPKGRRRALRPIRRQPITALSNCITRSIHPTETRKPLPPRVSSSSTKATTPTQASSTRLIEIGCRGPEEMRPRAPAVGCLTEIPPTLTSPASTGLRQRSSVVEQGNHNPLVGGSNPSAATSSTGMS